VVGAKVAVGWSSTVRSTSVNGVEATGTFVWYWMKLSAAAIHAAISPSKERSVVDSLSAVLMSSINGQGAALIAPPWVRAAGGTAAASSGTGWAAWAARAPARPRAS